jgi:tetratricopeptide (TPR) repeat protein
VALVLSVARTWTRNPDWRDNPSFFAALLRDAPHSGRSQWILGDEFLKAGDVSQALVSYSAAINILGGHYTIMTSIAERLLEIERYRAAEHLLLSAWESQPQFALAPSLLAWSRAQHGDARAAEAYARESLARFEPDPTRHHLLAWALAAQGRWDEARAARRRAEELGRATFWQQWMYRAYVLREDGDTLGALAAIDTAWARAPTGIGRASLDSVRVADFGLAPLLGEPEAPPAGP